MRYRAAIMSSTSRHHKTPDPALTEVETLYVEGLINFRLLFGHPVSTVERDFVYGEKTRRSLYFEAGSIFGLDLWQRNEYGTCAWAVYVLQAPAKGEHAVTVPQVKPGAKVLLEAVGLQRAAKALRLLREIEETTDPASLSPNRFLLTDFRLKASVRQRGARSA